MTALLDDESYSWVGRSTVYPAYEVTATDIAKFAHAIGSGDPVHFDVVAARSAGHEGVVAPLGYLAVIRYATANLVPVAELTSDGIAEDMVPPSRATRRMAGETATRFHRPIVAGDRISLTKTITDLTEKPGRSGPLAFVTYELAYRGADGRPVADETFVRILR